MFTVPEVVTEKAYALRSTSDGSPGQLPVFVAKPSEPASWKRPALLLIQEAFGVTAHIQDVCVRFAREGYVVVSPDLFYRTAEWSSYAYSDFQATAEPRKELTDDRVLGDLAAALDYIASMKEVDSSRIGVVGYCMGGRLSYFAASVFPQRVQAAAVYYGGGIVPDLQDLSKGPIARTNQMECPVIGFFGGKDQGIPVEAVAQIDRSLESAGVKHEIHLYPDAGHGFFCNERPSFHAASANDAWRRTLAWFETHLAPVPAGNRE